MNPTFTTGVTFGWILACMGLATIFTVAYGLRRREPEHLVFAFLALTMALHGWAVDINLEPRDTTFWHVGAALGFGSTFIGILLFIHYAYLFGGQRRPRLLFLFYLTALALNAITLLTAPFADQVEVVTRQHPLGISFSFSKSALTPLGAIVSLIGTLWSFMAVGLLARAYLQGRRDGLLACLGAAAFSLALGHDLALYLGLYTGPWLTPLGFLVFAFGVGCSLLIRHATLGKELEMRTLELERSYSNLRAAQAELVRKQQLAAVGELAAVIAHEVRNPLAIIMNAVTSLKRPELEKADGLMLLDILNEESRRLNRLVGDLLRYSRPVKVHRQETDIQDVISRAIRALSDREDIEVELVQEGAISPMSADPYLLRLVFDNLIANAAQAMGQAGGKLTITTRPDIHEGVDGISISIADTGHGMDAQVQSRATDPFFTTRPSGTGLGLAIVFRIVEAHGGTMAISSDPGEGTVVHLGFPLDSRISGLDHIGNESGPISDPLPIAEAL